MWTPLSDSTYALNSKNTQIDQFGDEYIQNITWLQINHYTTYTNLLTSYSPINTIIFFFNSWVQSQISVWVI